MMKVSAGTFKKLMSVIMAALILFNVVEVTVFRSVVFAEEDSTQHISEPTEKNVMDNQEQVEEETGSDVNAEILDVSDGDASQATASNPAEPNADEADGALILSGLSIENDRLTLGDDVKWTFVCENADAVAYIIEDANKTEISVGSVDVMSFTPEDIGTYTLTIVAVKGIEEKRVMDEFTVTESAGTEELLVTLSAATEYAAAKETPMRYTVTVEGGVKPVTLTYKVLDKNNDNLEQMVNVLVLDEDGSVDIEYLPEVYGVYAVEVSATDFQGVNVYTSAEFVAADRVQESDADWQACVSSVSLTGDWRRDIVAIAKTQLGYIESDHNFIFVNGETVGYTRYGDWYGDAYCDWGTAFASFCAHYSAIPENYLPKCADGRVMIERLGTVYQDAIETDPQTGDLVFLTYSDDGISYSMHVGILETVSEDSIFVIEGDYDRQVVRREYYKESSAIIGYASMASLMMKAGLLECDCYDVNRQRVCGESCDCACHSTEQGPMVVDDSLIHEENASTADDNNEQTTIETVTGDGAVITVSGCLPEGASLRVEPISEEMLSEILKKVNAETSFFAYDISVIDAAGKVWQPEELDVRVTVSSIDTVGGTEVVHYTDNGEIEVLSAVSDDNAITFTTTSFSPFVGVPQSTTVGVYNLNAVPNKLRVLVHIKDWDTGFPISYGRVGIGTIDNTTGHRLVSNALVLYADSNGDAYLETDLTISGDKAYVGGNILVYGEVTKLVRLDMDPIAGDGTSWDVSINGMVRNYISGENSWYATQHAGSTVYHDVILSNEVLTGGASYEFNIWLKRANKGNHTVTFDTSEIQNPSSYGAQTVADGDQMIHLADPVHATDTNKVFAGWLVNGRPFNVLSPIYFDVLLVPKWINSSTDEYVKYSVADTLTAIEETRAGTLSLPDKQSITLDFKTLLDSNGQNAWNCMEGKQLFVKDVSTQTPDTAVVAWTDMLANRRSWGYDSANSKFAFTAADTTHVETDCYTIGTQVTDTLSNSNSQLTIHMYNANALTVTDSVPDKTVRITLSTDPDPTKDWPEVSTVTLELGIKRIASDINVSVPLVMVYQTDIDGGCVQLDDDDYHIDNNSSMRVQLKDIQQEEPTGQDKVIDQYVGLNPCEADLLSEIDKYYVWKKSDWQNKDILADGAQSNGDKYNPLEKVGFSRMSFVTRNGVLSNKQYGVKFATFTYTVSIPQAD